MKRNTEHKEVHLQSGKAASKEQVVLFETNVNPLAAYEAPQVEVIEVQVEQGFAQSGIPNDYGWGGGL